MKVCKVRLVQIQWPAAEELWPLLIAHNWRLSVSGWPLGSVYPDTETFAWGEGGCGLEAGHVLTHDAERCTHE